MLFFQTFFQKKNSTYLFSINSSKIGLSLSSIFSFIICIIPFLFILIIQWQKFLLNSQKSITNLKYVFDNRDWSPILHRTKPKFRIITLYERSPTPFTVSRRNRRMSTSIPWRPIPVTKTTATGSPGLCMSLSLPISISSLVSPSWTKWFASVPRDPWLPRTSVSPTLETTPVSSTRSLRNDTSSRTPSPRRSEVSSDPSAWLPAYGTGISFLSSFIV